MSKEITIELIIILKNWFFAKNSKFGKYDRDSLN